PQHRPEFYARAQRRARLQDGCAPSWRNRQSPRSFGLRALDAPSRQERRSPRHQSKQRSNEPYRRESGVGVPLSDRVWAKCSQHLLSTKRVPGSQVSMAASCARLPALDGKRVFPVAESRSQFSRMTWAKASSEVWVIESAMFFARSLAATAAASP